MKKISVLFLLLFGFHHSNAQTADVLASHHKQILSFLFNRQSANIFTAEKTTGTQERMIAYSKLDGALTPTRLLGTISFSYSGTRGSTFDFNTMSYEYYYLPDLYKYPPFIEMQPIANNTASVAYDSFLEFRPRTSTFGGDTATFYRKYNGILPLYSAHEISDTSLETDSLGYDPFGNVLFDIVVYKYPHRIDTSYGQFFTYDSKQRLIMDSIANNAIYSGIQPFYIMHYNYNSRGNLISVSMPGELWTISYTSDNKIQTVVYDTGLSNTPYQIDSFAYTTGVPYYTFTSDSLRSKGKWRFNASSLKYVNADLLPDSMIELYVSLYPKPDKTKHTYSYTAENNPITDYVNFTSLAGSNVVSTTYYYETYTGINNIPNPTASFQLYPNPATDKLYIKQIGQQISGAAQLYLYDASGKLVQRNSLMLNNTAISIPISGRASGIYFYSLQQNDIILTSGKFVKQ